MKSWEEIEFEEQQEAVRKWAKKKFYKIYLGNRLARQMARLTRLARICYGNDKLLAYVKIEEVREDGE